MTSARIQFAGQVHQQWLLGKTGVVMTIDEISKQGRFSPA